LPDHSSRGRWGPSSDHFGLELSLVGIRVFFFVVVPGPAPSQLHRQGGRKIPTGKTERVRRICLPGYFEIQTGLYLNLERFVNLFVGQ
jgi:hypothetical protein